MQGKPKLSEGVVYGIKQRGNHTPVAVTFVNMPDPWPDREYDRDVTFQTVGGREVKIWWPGVAEVEEGVTWAWGDSMAEKILAKAIETQHRINSATTATIRPIILDTCVELLEAEFGPEAAPGKTWREAIFKTASTIVPA